MAAREAEDMGTIAWSDYEDLTRWIVEQLAARAGVTTTRIERGVEILGKATVNNIDVVWEFLDADGRPQRIVFEARSYGRRIDQQRLHSWRSIVDDITSEAMPTVGVMVTTTGYQAGAQRVADTYGIVIVELREPTAADTANRVMEVGIEMVARRPFVRAILVTDGELLDPEGAGPMLDSELELVHQDGRRVRLVDELLAGELNPWTEPPTPAHQVTRVYDPAVVLEYEGRPVARVQSVTAEVGEHEHSTSFRVGGLDRIAWLMKNTLTGAHTWFAHDGKVYETD
jgi:hypothetical protein